MDEDIWYAAFKQQQEEQQEDGPMSNGSSYLGSLTSVASLLQDTSEQLCTIEESGDQPVSLMRPIQRRHTMSYDSLLYPILSELQDFPFPSMAPAVGALTAMAADTPFSIPPYHQQQPQSLQQPAIKPEKRRRKSTSATSHPFHDLPVIKNENQQFECQWPGCTKAFSRFYNLKSHQRTHNGERPFECEYCHASFGRNHDLKRHVRIHTGQRPYECDNCGKTFSRLDALNRHLKSVTSGKCTSA